jgi:microcystin-dependent protein
VFIIIYKTISKFSAKYIKLNVRRKKMSRQALLDGITLGCGCDTKLGKVNGIALDYESIEPIINSGQDASIEYKVIKSSNDLSESMDIGVSAAYHDFGFSISASAKYAAQHSVHQYSTYVFVRCNVINQSMNIIKPVPEPDVNEWRKNHSLAEFEKIYGCEYLSGIITGGELIGIIEIKGTSESEQQNISAKLSGSGWGFKASGSFSKALSEATSNKEVSVSIFRIGGDDKFDTDIDGLIKQAEEFPKIIENTGVPYMGIYKRYDESIKFENAKEYSEDDSIYEYEKNRDNLNILANQYLKLKDLRENVKFVLDHFNDYQIGKGVIFEEYKNLELEDRKKILDGLKKDYDGINKSIDEVVECAHKCRENKKYEMPGIFEMESQLPRLEGENMELENLIKELDILKTQVVPKGTISMWSGKITEIPNNWTLCDGKNGTPDLQGKFIVGYDPNDGDYNLICNTGGEKKHTLTEKEMPSHTHTIQGGEHSHDYIDSYYTQESLIGSKSGETYWLGHPLEKKVTTDSSTHTHTANIAGESLEHENRPPFYVLAYIIKL